MDLSLSKLLEMVKDREAWPDMTEQQYMLKYSKATHTHTPMHARTWQSFDEKLLISKG